MRRNYFVVTYISDELSVYGYHDQNRYWLKTDNRCTLMLLTVYHQEWDWRTNAVFYFCLKERGLSLSVHVHKMGDGGAKTVSDDG